MSLERLLERQAGVVTLAQAADCGMSPDTVRRRVRDRRWEQLLPRVYRHDLDGRPASVLDEIRQTVAAAA